LLALEDQRIRFAERRDGEFRLVAVVAPVDGLCICNQICRATLRAFVGAFHEKVSRSAGLTSRITDPAPVITGLEQQRYRGIRCIRFVKASCSMLNLILDRQLEMPWHVNWRIDATNDALLEGVQLQHAKLVGHGAN
jgi:hypothetical protein